MAPRVRPFASAGLRGVRAGIALTWAGTQFSQDVQLDGDVTAIDISTALTDRLDRNLTNAVLQTVRGTVNVITQVDVALTFTRMIMSMGIAWADSAFIDPTDVGITESALFPNPLSESMKWIWRTNVVKTGFGTQADTAGGLEFAGGQGSPNIDVHVKSKRKQPSIQHRLYFFYCKTTPAQGFDANFTSAPAKLTGALNVLMKTP